MSKGSEKGVVVEILTREGCCLCEEMKAIVKEANRIVAFEIREIDVSKDKKLMERYGQEVPLLFINGRKAFKYKVTMDEFLKRLERAKSP